MRKEIIGVSVHMGEETEMAVQFVKSHDSVREDYYRIHLGDNATVYMSNEMVVRLARMIDNRDRA